MTAPAVVSWAAYLGRMHLEGTWLAFLGYAWTPYILSALAIAELVTDQLPKTPSGTSSGGLVAGVIGTIAGTIGRVPDKAGGKDRRQDLPIALLEDTIAIGGAILIVMSFS